MKITINNITKEITPEIILEASLLNNLDAETKIKAFFSIDTDITLETFLNIRLVTAIIVETFGIPDLSDTEFNRIANEILDENLDIDTTNKVRKLTIEVFEAGVAIHIKNLDI